MKAVTPSVWQQMDTWNGSSPPSPGYSISRSGFGRAWHSPQHFRVSHSPSRSSVAQVISSILNGTETLGHASTDAGMEC